MRKILYLISIICTFFCVCCKSKLSGETLINLEQLIGNLSLPVYLTNAGDGTGRLFIVEQSDRVVILKDKELVDTAFLDIRSRVESGGEMGLLSIAFHPDYEENGRFFVNYTMSDAGLKTVIAEYRVSDTDLDVANTDEQVILEIEQPFTNHNGGQLQFGPDGFLYIGMSDGGSGGDPIGHGQNINTLLGSLLRIDVDNGLPFSIPSDNPFVGMDGEDEIWAYGLRNPWRFSFDKLDGRLFLADVGQSDFEEINIIQIGGNYGWNIMEGFHCFPPSKINCDQDRFMLPITEYSHDEGRSVTGGYVYRGNDIPELVGSYLFADFSTSIIWSLTETNPGTWGRKELLGTDFSISSFGEDEQGEIYVVDYDGAIFKIIPMSSEIPSPAASPTPTPFGNVYLWL